jgi:Tfp pilus assembly protein PilX
MRSRFLLRLRPARGEDGYALLTVVAAMFVLTILATGALGYALNGIKAGKKDSDWTAALAAAQAGIDDFLSKVRADEGYWRKTPQYAVANPTAAASVDCANIAMQVPMGAGAPCRWSAATPVGWRNVASSTTASFHYDVDASSTHTNGLVKLTSTGRVGKVTRTVTSQVSRQGFGEFLYLSDYETTDPANRGVYASDQAAADAQAKCTQHYYEPDTTVTPNGSKRSDSCPLISFSGNDTINGPLHSNDTISVSGSAQFVGTATTSWPACQGRTGKNYCYINPPNISGTPSKSPIFRPMVGLPTTVAGLKTKTDATAENPGCLYTGPTRIKFTGNGRMNVWSPYTRTVNPHCGSLTQLNGPTGAGADVAVPVNSLIYVEDVPATQAEPQAAACAPNSVAPGFPQAGDWNMVDIKWDYVRTTKTATTGTERSTGRKYWDVATKKELFPNATTNTVSATSNWGPVRVYTDPQLPKNDTARKVEVRKPLGAEAQCRTGTIYVDGALKGKVTLVADNSILVTDHLTYSDGHVAPNHTGHGESVLGLIAFNSVLVYHPVTCRFQDRQADQTCSGADNLNRAATNTVFKDAKIHASILTLQHSITVQAYNQGSSLGNLTIFGSMAQRFRGAVATGSGSTTTTGYAKDYNYDENLKFDPPPHFLDPTSGGWGAKTFAEIEAAYPA